MRFLLFFVLLASGLAQAESPLPAPLADRMVTNSQTWAEEQGGNRYAIQLMSARDIRNFPSTQELDAIRDSTPEAQLVYHPKLVKNQRWHTIIWGSFASAEQAQNSYSQLPSKWRTRKPWVRQLKTLKFIAPQVQAKPAVAPKVVAKPVARPEPIKHAAPAVTSKVVADTPPPRPRPTVAKTPPISTTPAPPTEPVKPRPADFDTYDAVPIDHATIDGVIASQGTYPYIKLGAGQLNSDIDAVIDSENEATALELALGLDIGYYLGVEVGYLNASGGDTTYSGNLNSALQSVVGSLPEYEFEAWKFSGLAKLPLDPRRKWQPFGQVGFIHWESTASEVIGTSTVRSNESSDTDLFYAAGFEYKFSRYVAFGVKYSLYDLDDQDVDTITAEVTWRWEGKN